MRRALFIVITVAIGSTGIVPDAMSQSALPPSERRAWNWSVEIGAVVATPLVEDGNGVTVRTAAGPFVGAQLAMRRNAAAAFTVGARASSAALRVASTSRDWRPGRSQRFDLRVGVETSPISRLTLGVSGFAGLVTGPDDVIPFRRNDGRVAVWGGELGGAFPLIRERNIDLLIGVDAARLASQRGENPALAGGWIGALRLGVRHAGR
jgi:hypothetical protein